MVTVSSTRSETIDHDDRATTSHCWRPNNIGVSRLCVACGEDKWCVVLNVYVCMCVEMILLN